jgi:hypothetical protein
MGTRFENNPITMPISANRHLTELHGALLQLHKTLLDMERRAYERHHGRVTASELLELAIQDQQFAWLRAVSEILVHIEELLDNAKPVDEKEALSVLTRVQTLLVPAEDGAGFARNYFLALQNDPGVVLAHRDVWDVLTVSAADTQRKLGGLH